jgi:hypothetical protein
MININLLVTGVDLMIEKYTECPLPVIKIELFKAQRSRRVALSSPLSRMPHEFWTRLWHHPPKWACFQDHGLIPHTVCQDSPQDSMNNTRHVYICYGLVT